MNLGSVASAVPVKVGDMVLLMETSVVTVVGTEPTGAGDRALDWVMESFQRVQAAIEQIAVSTAQTISRTAIQAAKPDVVEVEFGLKVSAKGDVIVAGASGEASLNVTLKYYVTSALARQDDLEQ